MEALKTNIPLPLFQLKNLSTSVLLDYSLYLTLNIPVMKYLLLPLLFLATHTFAARVDTILVHSDAMNKDIKCVVIQPEHAATLTPAPTRGTPTSTHFPVVYLLHGYGANYAQWPATAPQLKKEA